MPLDHVSEEIAHFIGLFHLETEGYRLRLEYESFSVDREKLARSPDQRPDLVVSSPYALKGFDPGVAYQSVAPLLPHPPSVQFDGWPTSAEMPVIDPRRLEKVAPDDPIPLGGIQVTQGLLIPPPNSILISISQTVAMWDNDLLLVTGQTAFIDPDQLMTEFLALIDMARAASALNLGDDLEASLVQPDGALGLVAQVAEFAPADNFEVQLVLRGEAAQGSFVNGRDLALTGEDGEVPTNLPDFLDLLPAHLAAARAEPEDAKDPFALRLDGTTDVAKSPFGVDPGHKVVTGGNLVMNEATIVQVWVDAPVIAVAGDAIRLDVVSQINVMYGAGLSDGGAAALPSQRLNAVSVEVESAFGPDGPPPLTDPGLFPDNWSVVRITGDVIAVNLLKQYVFASDADRAEVTITAAATYITTGENIIANSVLLNELGFHYDLILIGGSMVTLNIVDQINVLWDADRVGGGSGAAVSHHGGDNLQYNLAQLKQTGLDQITELPASFRTALDDMAAGARTIGREVARDERFEGLSELKVLHIEGDLIKANILQQHNFLNDNDQIQVMLEDFLAAGEGLELVTGSNAQLNAARIHDVGLDSEIMVGGNVYSDALIYQAQLLDEAAPPTGVGLVPLASEAVAFLADDMVAAAPAAQHGSAPMATEHAASSDLLHAIIA